MKLNKHLLFPALMLAALTTGAWAQTQIASNATPPGTPPAAAANTAAPPAPVTAADIQELKDALAAQQRQIQALQALLQAKEQGQQLAPTAGLSASMLTAAPPVAASPIVARPSGSSAAEAPAILAANPQEAPTNKSQQNAGSSDERVRNLEREIQALGPIAFSGDIRLRGEPFFGGPSDQDLDRMRARVRARFNAIATLGDQFRAGLTLASGDINDPTSTHQTLTGFYTRKAVALDQAFVEYKPSAFKPLTLIGGKFRYPWYNTELTWDKDLNPEGVAETLAFNLDTPLLKRIAFIGFQLPFAEVAGTSSTDKRIAQQITYGGQLQTNWQLASWLNFSAYAGYYDYRGADSIALALARASTKNPQTPFSGYLPLTSGNPVQDSTYTTTATTIITVNGTAYPTGVTSISNAQFASKFGLFDTLARFDINTGHPRIPITFLGDYVQNTEACGNVPNLIAVPANTATTTYKQTVNSPCDSHYRRGYWAEGDVGRLEKKGDLQIGYTRIYIEREAVLGNFNYSDIRQGTNVSQHRFTSFYQFDPRVQLGFTALVGRPLGTTEPWLTRLQFDTIFLF